MIQFKFPTIKEMEEIDTRYEKRLRRSPFFWLGVAVGKVCNLWIDIRDNFVEGYDRS